MRAIFPVLLACLAAGPALGNPFSEDPVSWMGDGIFRRAIDAAPEGMRCRGQTEPTQDGFTLSGRCASAASSATLELGVTLTDGYARLSLTSSLLDAPLTLSGFYTDDGLSAEASEPILIDDTPSAFRLQLNYTDDGNFVLTEFITPTTTGTRTELVQIQFRR